MTATEQTRVFAEALLGGHGEMLRELSLTVTSFVESRPRTRWTPVGLLSSVVANAARETGAEGVYVGVGLTRGRNPDAKRLTVADTAGIAWLWADIDVAGAAHDDAKAYAPDKATAIAIAMDCGLTPTVLVDSGHGIQAHWRLAEPLIFGAVGEDDDGVPIIDPDRVDSDRERARTLAWEWVTSLRIRAKRMGDWFVDPTTDLARLMRAPGTVNTKLPGDHRDVIVLDSDASRRYDLDQITSVLAPGKLLAPYRNPVSGMVSADLAGVDLAELWVAAHSYPDLTPDWLASVIESDWDPVLSRIWSGEADADYGKDDSAVDRALAVAILRHDLGVEAAVEAVMCRRLRIGRKVEKVDPAKRGAYYLSRTVGGAAAWVGAKDTAVAGHLDSINAAVEAMEGEPAPAELPPVESEPLDPPKPEPTEDEPESLDPPESDRPRMRAVPTPAPDPTVAHKDAPRAPRQGIDGPTPGKPDEVERNLGAQLAGLLGLPKGVSIWAVGMRRLEKRDEIRLWLYRTEATVVSGGAWKPCTVGSTRWIPKSLWVTRPMVRELLFNELHLQADVAREWPTEGRPRLYQLARKMLEGTPAEVAIMAVSGLLRQAQGTELFSTAVTTRDAWVVRGEAEGEADVWLPLAAVREAIKQGGFPPPTQVALLDTLDGLGCKIRAGMAESEGARVVVDESQWAMLGDELLTPALRAHVLLRAADRDAMDRRAGMRAVGGDD